MIFLDTNVISEIMRPEPSPIVVRWLAQHDFELALSSIVIAEISFGIESIRPAERSMRLAKTLTMLREHYQNRILSFDEEASLIYGDLMGQAYRTGKNLNPIDGMIAAIALRHGATLATRNTRDFLTIGLRITNPWTDD